MTLAETIGVFIFANTLILLCGVTGLFARLMKLIPHSLAAAMLAGVLLQFGLKAFSNLEGHIFLCGSMLAPAGGQSRSAPVRHCRHAAGGRVRCWLEVTLSRKG